MAILGQNSSSPKGVFGSPRCHFSSPAGQNAGDFPSARPTVKALVSAFLDYAKREYKADQYEHFCRAVKWVLEAGYADLPANDFSPKKLIAVRENMIASGRYCRKHINGYKNRIVRMFRWGVTYEIVTNADVVPLLQAIENLKKGHRGTRENPPRQAVSKDVVERTLPGLSPTVATMVQVQWFLGSRGIEVYSMRVGEIDTLRVGEKGLWYYRPGSYKTEGKIDEIPEFPLSKPIQRLLAPYLAGKKSTDAIFSPRTAMAELKAEKRANRTTKMTPSQKKRNKKRAARPNRYNEFYDQSSYRNAIRYGIAKVNKALPEGEKIPNWSPHQIRHGAGTEIALKYGLENAQAQLGHTSMNTTKGYAHIQLAKRENMALEQEDVFAAPVADKGAGLIPGEVGADYAIAKERYEARKKLLVYACPDFTGVLLDGVLPAKASRKEIKALIGTANFKAVPCET
ncbi:MAG: site-specific integrase [Bacteroidales bacterium]|nr:site-specific integrase [Bacteroidales bacterium]